MNQLIFLGYSIFDSISCQIIRIPFDIWEFCGANSWMQFVTIDIKRLELLIQQEN